MVPDLHLSLGNAQVQVAQDLQFAVRSAHVSAADGEVLLSRWQRSLQISLHVAVPELVEGSNVRSNVLKSTIHLCMETNICRSSSGLYHHSAQPGTKTGQSGGLQKWNV